MLRQPKKQVMKNNREIAGVVLASSTTARLCRAQFSQARIRCYGICQLLAIFLLPGPASKNSSSTFITKNSGSGRCAHGIRKTFQRFKNWHSSLIRQRSIQTFNRFFLSGKK
jgi:hypothetical protein